MPEHVKINLPAHPPGATFAPDAFADQIGQQHPLTVADTPVGDAVLTDAKVTDDGTAVELAFEVPDGTFPATGPHSYGLG